MSRRRHRCVVVTVFRKVYWPRPKHNDTKVMGGQRCASQEEETRIDTKSVEKGARRRYDDSTGSERKDLGGKATAAHSVWVKESGMVSQMEVRWVVLRVGTDTTGNSGDD